MPPSPHALGAAQLVAWGTTFYVIPPLLPRLRDALDVSLSTLGAAMTVGLLVNAAVSLAVGARIRRCGARMPMTAATLVAAAALVLIAASPHPALACVGLVVLGGAHAGLLYDAAFAAVATQRMTAAARQRAIHVITFWGGWAGLWALPATSLLDGLVGWRATLVGMAALLLATTLRVHARIPQPTRCLAPARHAAPAISVRLALAFALGAVAATAISIHGIALVSTRGVPLETAALVFALLAPLQILGRVWLMWRPSAHVAVPFALVGGGIVALAAAPHPLALALFVICFGMGAGLLTTIRAAIVLATVKPEHAVAHLAAYGTLASVARAFAPLVASWLCAATSYALTLVVLAALSAGAAVLVTSGRSAAG